METVLKAIADWIKGILTAGIMSNLSGLFDDVNTQVGNIAQQVGTDPCSGCSCKVSSSASPCGS